MKAIITLAVSAVLMSHSLLASEPITLIEPSSQSVLFFKKQVSGSSSLGIALKGLLDRYPHRTTEFVSIALIAYPDKYKEIITASVTAQPMFVDEIIMVANDYKVASATEIVQLAINAEPSYAGAATSAACKYNPEQFEEIIRTAVNAQPDSADQIAQKLVNAYPSKTMEILITTVKEVPFVGKYILDALLATVTDDDIKSENMIIMSIEKLANYPEAIERLVEIAEQRNIESDKIRLSAIRGGLSEQAIVAVINEHYPQLESPAQN